MSDDSFRMNPGHHDVFISYAQEDKPIADAVCAKLEARHIRCWIAPRDIPPGKSFPEAIIEGIEDGKVVVLIFSSFANKSPHVTRELTNAVNKGRIIIPFRIEEVLPSKSMEYLISVPHWLDAVSPPLEKHIDLLIRTVESIIEPDRKPSADPIVAPPPEIPKVTELLAPVPPVQVTTAPAAAPVLSYPEHGPVPLPEPASPSRASPGRYMRKITIAGIVIAGLILLFLGLQAGVFNFVGGPNTSDSIQTATSAPINYRSADVPVNTVTLTTEPTQTLAPDTELFFDVSKDNSNAMVTVQFNGGPGMGLVKDNQVILTRSDGTVTEGKLNFNQRLSEVRLQGTRGTDRLRVIVTLFSGSAKTIVDTLLPYRAYH
jgi:hypothetical protein